MILNKGESLNKHSFLKDPFASINAVHEELLEKNFSTPSYYYSLIGVIDSPKLSIVMKPRVSGKTAQRII